ncbi:MAG: hypothetical protein IPN70_05330 [Candidatus Moraniibacteriota bacterium]|nr:MAG: hypothetical protein IPN70_05330 [Candidatus Moranbacteria bacterium]
MEITFGEIVASLLRFIASFWNSPFLDFLRFLLAVYTIVLFLDLIMLLILRDVKKDIRVGKFGADMPVAHRKFIKKQWKIVSEHMSGHTDSDWKIAILEADRIVDYVLEISRFPGTNFRERVELASSEQLSRKEDLLRAHLIRNSIIKESSFSLDHSTAKELIAIYESVLSSWGAL